MTIPPRSRRSDAEEALARWKRLRQGATDPIDPGAFAERSREEGPPAVRASQTRRLEIGVMLFSAPAGEVASGGLYDLALSAAAEAEARGLSAIWMPERHFHRFGGPYPNPAVLAAAVAARTRTIRLRSGSVVLPLHSPLEVAESWAMVDNLSAGRVEISFGSGWNPNDFVLAPDAFADRAGVCRERIETVRRLWRGESLSLPNGRGEQTVVRIYPRPVQAELPVWITATGNPETFRWAGAHGFDVLTMVLGGELADVARNVAVFRAARHDAGLDPDSGRVALMLHSCVHPDEARVGAAIREPFTDYVRSSLDSQRHGTDEGRALTPEQREKMVAFAYERYTRSAALFGSPARCRELLETVRTAGITEVAALIDFGIPDDLALEGVAQLAALRAMVNDEPAPRGEGAIAIAHGGRRTDEEPIAVIGMAARLPGSPDIGTFWDNVAAGRVLLGPPPEARFSGMTPAGLERGGFIDDVEGFDCRAFRIAPAEAALMDPHQRLFLETVRAALEDAGLAPEATRGTDTGVFAAVYAQGWRERRDLDEPVDPLAIAGAIHTMVANRTSFVFDWHGPSELVDTACSSSLVAVHRAIGALRAGECAMAVAGGVSLLLSARESEALGRLGLIAPDGACRPFDTEARGQVRGEGVGAVVLKSLSRALADGDPIHAVIRGSAVTHNGDRSASLTLPNSSWQTECILAAWRGVDEGLASLGLIEAHGAGSEAGDLAEINAFAAACGRLAGADAPTSWPIGSVKANIGSLDAAGGVAGLIKAVLALEHRVLPPQPSVAKPVAQLDAGDVRFRIPASAEPWAEPRMPNGRVLARRAAVHAYGLGGVNAHLVVEQAPVFAAASSPSHAEPVVVSAADPAALRSTLRSLGNALTARDAPGLAAAAHTLRTGRDALPVRWGTIAASVPELVATVDLWLEGRPSPALVTASFGSDGLPASFGADKDLWRLVQAFVAGDGVDWTPITASGTRRVHLPPVTPARRRFPLDPAIDISVERSKDPGTRSPVTAFYDFATRSVHLDPEAEVYLTLAPFPEPVPGFSWTSTIQHPERHPEHHALMLRRQREMRAVLFGNVDFERVRHAHDIGCGMATDVIRLARRYPHLTTSGYTLSGEQAAAGQARIAALSLQARASVQARDSARTPIPRQSQLIFGVEVAHHIEDKDALFERITEALDPEGWLVLADSVAGTVAPINLPDIGSFTWPQADHAELYARHGLEIVECIDVSQEISNFMRDPGLDAMLEREADISRDVGKAADYDLAVRFQRAWDAYGQALGEGLVLYLLITARPADDRSRALEANRRQLGIA